ncbi:hypothetical protein D3C80_1912440 [compost metagenome]
MWLHQQQVQVPTTIAVAVYKRLMKRVSDRDTVSAHRMMILQKCWVSLTCWMMNLWQHSVTEDLEQ